MRFLANVENGHIIDPDDGWVLLEEHHIGGAVSDEDIIRAAEHEGWVFVLKAAHSKVYDNWLKKQREEEDN
jgi:hypothetical protein